jgi:D-alanyl-D-alanine carboxypeptidase/D-alanyl-D-alanine-endopeptidase (penicillin-binding protein 4)
MKSRVNQLLVTLLSIFVIFSSFAEGQQNGNLLKKVRDFQRSKELKNAQWSVTAKYVNSGKDIISYNNDYSLAPASGLKLITTAAALDALGPGYKFKTKIYYEGEIRDNVLYGNLYVVGGLDPTLGSDQVKGSLPLDSLMMEWHKNLEDKGIKKINGSIIADDLLFKDNPISGKWFWEDMGNYYGAGCSALCINDNLYKLYFAPADIAGEPAKLLRMEPEVPNMEFTNFMRTGKAGSGDNGYIYSAPKQFNAALRGTVPAGYDEFSIKGSIPDPALFAVQYFTKYLNDNGLKVTGEPSKLKAEKLYQESQLIHTHYSPALREINYIINKKSFNLYAEHILIAMGLEKYGKAEREAGTKYVNEFLESNNIDTHGLMLYDGSGLSRSNAITTNLMTDMLIALNNKNYYDDYEYSMSLAGDPDDIGYFSSFGNGTAIDENVRIKSGSIANVKSHSGYVWDKSGDMIAFSFIANNFSCSGSLITQIHKNLLIYLANIE